MFESKNVKAAGKIAIVDGVWEAGHRVAAHASLDDSPTFGRFKDHRNRSVGFIKKPKRPASRRGLRDIVLPRLVRFRHRDGRSVAFERASRRFHDFFMCATSYFA